MATYVMSDIHGYLEKFDAMMKKLNLSENDRVYFLGDVIDRGEHGIEILKRIMMDSRFTLLLGNHEQMMSEALNPHDFYKSVRSKRLWYNNGGEITHQTFLKLSPSQQREILNYLKSLPIAITDLTVNGRMFYLVHASAVQGFDRGTIYQEVVEDAYPFVWNRMNENSLKFEDRTIIAGHTMTAYITGKCEIYSDHEDLTQAKYIDIDCGCAMGTPNCKFACLCLDDMSVIYV